MVKAYSYGSYIFFSIFILLTLTIIFINPYTFHKTYFDKDFNRTNGDEIALSSNYEIKDFVEKWTDNIPGDALRLRKSNRINETQLNDIIDNNDRATDSLRAYKSGGNEIDLYVALFYTQVAWSYEKTYPFINCAEEIYRISKKYRPLFYYLSKADRDRIIDLKSTQKNINEFLKYSTHYMEEKERIISITKDVRNIESRYDLHELKCEEFERYIKEDYRRQRYWFLFKLAAIIVIAILSFLLGNLLCKKRIIKFERFIHNIGGGIKEAFSPREIKDETIKSILKINTVTTTLMAFLGIALTITGFNNWFFVGLILVSVWSLLSSILIGIISLNNQKLLFKKACYKFFIFGLSLFIFFFLYILVVGGIATTFREMAEAVKTYLSNQTIVK